MERFKALMDIDDIGDLEGNFIVDIATGVSGFINTIDAKLNKMKAQHLSYIDNLQNSNLTSELNKKDYDKETFIKVKNENVYKVPKSKTFYDTNDFYIGKLNALIEHKTFIEDIIVTIKRFRTKEARRLSVQGPSSITLEVEKILEGIKKDSVKVFDTKDTSEYAPVGKYFGNVKAIHENIDAMYDLDSKLNDKDLHAMTENVDRLASELKKLVKLLDSTTSVVSRDAMNSIVLDVKVCADYITSISNLYYLHITSISSLVSLKNLIK